MPEVAVATTSRLAADAAAEVADRGGNAVDCAVAAALLTMNTEPGVCALAGSVFVTVWPTEGEAITIDGNVAVPGLGGNADISCSAIESVHMDYGGGVETLIGAASVAVPGSLAALDLAIKNYGTVDWRTVVEPSIRATREGFPLSAACHHYLQYSAAPIFSRSEDGFAALHDASGILRPAGSTIVVPHLADSLEAIASEGSRIFYEGEIATRIADYIQESGGRLDLTDLQKYQPILRKALITQVADWSVASNPPPAVGGAILSAMLLGFRDKNFTRWDEAALLHLINVQHAALTFRTATLDVSDDLSADTAKLLDAARSGELISRFASASTVHTSAVDDNGLACSVTASSGYGTGEMPPATGLWLNNCIGELELNHKGLDAGPAGSRLPSNMAPSAARSGERVLAVGSPGADRITTALQQFLVGFLQLGLPLTEAVSHSRIHLEVRGEQPVVAFEPGLELPQIPMALKPYPEKGMYFGGIGVALYDPATGFEVAADPRREGGTYTGAAACL